MFRLDNDYFKYRVRSSANVDFNFCFATNKKCLTILSSFNEYKKRRTFLGRKSRNLPILSMKKKSQLTYQPRPFAKNLMLLPIFIRINEFLVLHKIKLYLSDLSQNIKSVIFDTSNIIVLNSKYFLPISSKISIQLIAV